MTDQTSSPSPKRSTIILVLSAFLGLILLGCIAVGVLIVIAGPPVYKTVMYSYYFNRAGQDYYQSKYQEAISDYSQALTFDPNSVQAYEFRGNAYAHLEDYTHFSQDLEKAIQLAPSSAFTHNSFCWYGSILGHATDLLKVCEQAVALEENNPAYRDSRGLARALTGDYQGAILDFQFFVDHVDGRFGVTQADVRKRLVWIAALRKGINPFDAAELHELLDDNGPPDDTPSGQEGL